MQTPTFSILPSPPLTGSIPAPNDGARIDGAGAGASFAAFLQNQVSSDPLPATWDTQTIGEYPTMVSAAGETGKTLPVSGKDQADDTVADEVLPVCEVVIALAPLVAADVVRITMPSQQNPAAVDPALAVSSSRLGEASIDPSRPTDAAARTSLAVLAPTLSPKASLVRAEAMSPALELAASPSHASDGVPVGPVAGIAQAHASSPVAVSLAVSSSGEANEVFPLVAGGQMVDAKFAAPLVPAVTMSAETMAKSSPDESVNEARTSPATAAQLSPRLDAAPTGGDTTERDKPRNSGIAKVNAESAATPTRTLIDFAVPPTAVSASAGERVSPAPFAQATPTAPVALIDGANSVATVVDRLLAAREAGMGALTSIAVANREFGEITVSFAASDAALEVSLTAEDQSAQRALAAALHSAERITPREPGTSTAQSLQNTAASTFQERGGEAQMSRDGSSGSSGRHARGDAPDDARRAARSSTPVRDEPTGGEPAGIYV